MPQARVQKCFPWDQPNPNSSPKTDWLTWPKPPLEPKLRPAPAEANPHFGVNPGTQVPINDTIGTIKGTSQREAHQGNIQGTMSLQILMALFYVVTIRGTV